MPKQPTGASRAHSHASLATPRLCVPGGGRLAVSIPPALIVALTVFGLCAVAVTGFLGYPLGTIPASPLDPWFSHPWLLFIWLLSLAVVVIALLYRGKQFAPQRGRALIVLVGGAAVEALVYLYFQGKVFPKLLQAFLQGVVTHISAFISWIAHLQFLHGPFLYVAVNYAIIIILTLDMFGHWYLRAHPNALTKLKILPAPWRPATAPRNRFDDAQQIFAGDFVVRGLVVFAMALVVGRVLPQVIQTGAHQTCTLDMLGGCGGGPWSLWVFDLLLACLALVLGLGVLFVVGMQGITSTTEATPASPNESTAKGNSTSKGISTTKGDPSAKGRPSLFRGLVGLAVEAAGRVVDPLVTTIRESTLRLIAYIRVDLTRALRFLLWVALMLVGIAGAGALSLAMQRYFHQPPGAASASGAPTWLLPLLASIPASLLMVLLGMVFVLGIVTALAALAWNVATLRDELNFILVIAVYFVIYFCLLSFVLLAFVVILRIVHECYPQGSDVYCGAARSHPFELGILTYVSLVLLIVFGAMYLLRGRKPPAQVGAQPTRGTPTDQASA